jgi:hypothetical protein
VKSPSRPRFRSEQGQDLVEYAGALVLVSALIAALAAVGLVGQVAHAAECSVTTVFHGDARACSPTPTPTAGAPGRPAVSGSTGSTNWTTAAAAAGAPTPDPQPGPVPEWRWPASAGNHADQLPTGGDRPYSPPKQGRGNPVRVRGGGFIDQDGNIWEWAPAGQQHGGPHWDVQHPDGSHTNVAPDGTVIGKDNFPNKRRVPQPPPPPPEGSGDGNTAKIVGGAAAVAGGGAVIWWLGKLASPLCGPAAIACAFVF